MKEAALEDGPDQSGDAALASDGQYLPRAAAQKIVFKRSKKSVDGGFLQHAGHIVGGVAADANEASGAGCFELTQGGQRWGVDAGIVSFG